MENGGNRTSTGSSSNGGGSNASNVPLHPTEHQIYATIQRKQPPFPPFGGGGGGGVGNGCTKGFDTIDRLKMFQVNVSTRIIVFSTTSNMILAGFRDFLTNKIFSETCE